MKMSKIMQSHREQVATTPVAPRIRTPMIRAACLVALANAGFVAPVQIHAQGTAGATEQVDEIVVTGFRGSLNTALAEKRAETSAIDVIAAEDIGKFPDSNLAES